MHTTYRCPEVRKSGSPDGCAQTGYLNPSRWLALREAARFLGWALASCTVTALIDTLLCWLV
ncbi:MAG: hypothetical protein AAB263_02560 [Planctomycetota bacterium]